MGCHSSYGHVAVAPEQIRKQESERKMYQGLLLWFQGKEQARQVSKVSNLTIGYFGYLWSLGYRHYPWLFSTWSWGDDRSRIVAKTNKEVAGRLD